MLSFDPNNTEILATQSIVSSATRFHERTEFLFNFSGISERARALHGAAGITFARDGIVFHSVGSQIQLTASDAKMREVFSEILNRRIFTVPAFQMNVANISPYIEPVTTIFLQHLEKVDCKNHACLLPNTILYSLVRHIAYVWPNTNSSELSLSSTERPPLALRLALDYIHSMGGMVKSVNDVASHTNVGLRALETIFSERLGIGIKRYCKCVMLRTITQQLQNENHRLTEIARKFGVSNVGRLRKELNEYATDLPQGLYPWEIYDLIRDGQLKRPQAGDQSLLLNVFTRSKL